MVCSKMFDTLYTLLLCWCGVLNLPRFYERKNQRYKCSEVAYVNDDLYSAVMILILPSLFIYLQFGVIRVRKVLYMYCSS